jgi:hypothetical protein
MNSRHQAQRKTLALPVWAAALIWFLTYLARAWLWRILLYPLRSGQLSRSSRSFRLSSS